MLTVLFKAPLPLLICLLDLSVWEACQAPSLAPILLFLKKAFFSCFPFLWCLTYTRKLPLTNPTKCWALTSWPPSICSVLMRHHQSLSLSMSSRPPTPASCLPYQTLKPYYFPSLQHPDTPSSKGPKEKAPPPSQLRYQALLTSFWISLLRAEIFIFMSSSSWSGKGCTWGLASDSSGEGNTRSARGMYHLQSYCWCFLQTSPRETWVRENLALQASTARTRKTPERDLLRTCHGREWSVSLTSLIRKPTLKKWQSGSRVRRQWSSGPWPCQSSGSVGWCFETSQTSNTFLFPILCSPLPLAYLYLAHSHCPLGWRWNTHAIFNANSDQ